MKIKNVLAVAAGLAAFGGSAQAADYRFLSSWDQNYAGYKTLIEPF
ncbi:unnamed protein product, partial [marine sediment metagenome]